METLNPLRPIRHLANYLLHLSGNKPEFREVDGASLTIIEGSE